MLQELNSIEVDELVLDEDSLYDDSKLCEAYEGIRSGNVTVAMNRLFLELKKRHEDSSELEWKRFVEKVCLTNPLMEILLQDPFTERSYKKPRGHDGDAVLMDYIYGANTVGPPDGTTEIGKQIFRFTTNTPPCQAVRNRARIMATIIDQFASEFRQPDIASIAAGHMREANLCGSIATGRLGKWVGFDTDPESTKEIERCYGKFGVETRLGTIRQLLRRTVSLDTYNLVYSMGLFDYLHQRLAAHLMLYFFDLLRPGGELIVGNFLPTTPGRAYMESFMTWNLVYRTKEEMLELADVVDQSQVKSTSLFVEDANCIVFLRMQKR